MRSRLGIKWDRWAEVPQCVRLRHEALDDVVTVARPTPFEQLQARLLARALRAFPQPHFDWPLRTAILRAASQAESTDFPMLVLPELFQELAIAAMLRADYFLHYERLAEEDDLARS